VNTAQLGSDRSGDRERAAGVLQIALLTFARYGYRKTSMEEIARAADISRPGLYYLFPSKPELFREAVTQALTADLAMAEQVLADPQRPLPDRLLEAFDHWTGRYIGPKNDIPAVIEHNPALLGSLTTDLPLRFADRVTVAIAESAGADADDVARTLISTALGIKHQVSTREEFLDRLRTAIRLLVPGSEGRV
jgi:AcrR family transcriptional regulator